MVLIFRILVEKTVTFLFFFRIVPLGKQCCDFELVLTEINLAKFDIMTSGRQHCFKVKDKGHLRQAAEEHKSLGPYELVSIYSGRRL